MLRNSFQRVLDEYEKARGESYVGHPLARFIRHELPAAFLEAFSGGFPEISWKGSPGTPLSAKAERFFNLFPA